MVGARAENRVEVQHAHAELLEVRQLLPHALQIAAEEIVGKVVAVFGDVEEGHFIPILVQDDILPVLGVHERVRAFAAAEAIHHDLIHDAIAHPRGGVGGVVNGELEALPRSPSRPRRSRCIPGAPSTTCSPLYSHSNRYQSSRGLSPTPICAS